MALNTETADHSVITRSFPGLGEAEKRVLCYAAAMGMEFDWSVLEVATEVGEEPLAESLERLVHMGILKELDWGDTYAFVQVVTLAQAYREVSSSRLRILHRKIAEAYEKLHPDPTPDVIPKMARHFHLGGIHAKSFLFNRYAATLSMNAFAPDVALQYLERALEDLAAIPGEHLLEEADLLKEIGEQYSAMGDNTHAAEFYGKSLRKIPGEEVTLRGLILLSLADAAREMDDNVVMRKYCGEAIRLLEKVGHKRGLAMAHRTLARVAYKEGQVELGKKEIELTLGLLDPEKDAKDVGGCYIEFGNVLSSMPTPEDRARALEYYNKAIRILESLHDYKELARAHHNLATCLATSQPREALNELMEARKCTEISKDRRFMGWILFNSVEMHLALGEDEEAAQNNAEAKRILSKYNDPTGMQHIAFNDGIIAQKRKAYEEAERAYLDSLRRAEGLGYPPVVVEVLIYLAGLYLDLEKKDEALKAMSRIRDIGEDMIDPVNLPPYEDIKKRLGT
jgi:tetratricopeptide (TPR) repeat protein